MSQTYIPIELRRLVRERARGCCEYCLFPEAYSLAVHELDHVVGEKHGGASIADNLALACILCNKYKGSDLTSVDPETNAIEPLYNPRGQRWLEHFDLNEGRIQPRSASGRVTVRLLQLNRADRIAERLLLVAAGILNAPTPSR
jgi:hypothetical protein